jgi:hypothetical protein
MYSLRAKSNRRSENCSDLLRPTSTFQLKRALQKRLELANLIFRRQSSSMTAHAIDSITHPKNQIVPKLVKRKSRFFCRRQMAFRELYHRLQNMLSMEDSEPVRFLD